MAPLPEGVAKSLAETKVEYRRLGNSGLRVSVPIVGCMSIGNPEWANWVIGPEKALPLLKAAYDRGVNTVCALILPCWKTENWLYLVGYCKHLFQWWLGESYCPSDQEIWDPAAQSGADDQGVQLRWRAAIPCVPHHRESEENERLREPIWWATATAFAK